MSLVNFKKELRTYVNPQKRDFLPTFFKTGKGEYGEGDKFLGIVVPDTKKIVNKYKSILTIKNIEELIYSKWHEERFAGWYLVSINYKKDPKYYYDFTITHITQLNNWDLVDMIAPKVIGEYNIESSEKLFIKWSKSSSLWIRRISIMSTWPKIRKNNHEITMKIANRFLNDQEDLIHKATGWMLREVAKRDEELVIQFITDNKTEMPRTMLRYAIERMDTKIRKKLLKL